MKCFGLAGRCKVLCGVQYRFQSIFGSVADNNCVLVLQV